MGEVSPISAASLKQNAQMHDMQARYYDPVIGRFLSVDPVTFTDTGNWGMFNRYSYTMNNPINMTDPDGELAVFATAAIEAYKQHKAGNGFDLGKIGSSAGKGALVGGVVGLTGATGAGAAATVALPSAAVGATGSAIVSITDDISAGASASELASNANKAFATGGIGAAIGGAASPAIGEGLKKLPMLGGAGNINGAGAAVGEVGANLLATGATEGAKAIPLPEPKNR